MAIKFDSESELNFTENDEEECKKTDTKVKSLNKYFECVQCNKTFTRASRLNQHKIFHTGEVEKFEIFIII